MIERVVFSSVEQKLEKIMNMLNIECRYLDLDDLMHDKNTILMQQIMNDFMIER
jgi:hypothetical protein